jgi:hypothetical protein
MWRISMPEIDGSESKRREDAQSADHAGAGSNGDAVWQEMARLGEEYAS